MSFKVPVKYEDIKVIYDDETEISFPPYRGYTEPEPDEPGPDDPEEPLG